MELEFMYPRDPAQASAYDTRRSTRHVIFTAETHNFPTGETQRRGKHTCSELDLNEPSEFTILPCDHNGSVRYAVLVANKSESFFKK